jgi:hypothetical protein
MFFIRFVSQERLYFRRIWSINESGRKTVPIRASRNDRDQCNGRVCSFSFTGI